MRRTAPRVNIQRASFELFRRAIRQRPCPRAAGKRNFVNPSEKFWPENFYFGELTFYRVQHFVVVGHLGLDFSDCFCVRVARENEKALRVVDGFATALLAQSAFLRRFLEKIED